jgi:hypothetical protein
MGVYGIPERCWLAASAIYAAGERRRLAGPARRPLGVRESGGGGPRESPACDRPAGYPPFRTGLRIGGAGGGGGGGGPFLLFLVVGAREGRKGRPSLIRWSQWLRPRDFQHISLLRGFLGLNTLADVVRFSIRVAEVAGADAPAKG